MTDRKTAPTYITAGVNELYQHMLPTQIYHKSKTRLETGQNVLCQISGQARILAGCSKLAQSKYLIRHDAALKTLFYEILKDLDLVTTVLPWCSLEQPKPLYENNNGKGVLGRPSILLNS